MPRRSGDTLTGGTKDVNPQLLNGVSTQSGADATTTTQFTLPVEKFGSASSQRARIIEVIRIAVELDNLAEVDSDVNIAFSTVSFGTTVVIANDPRVFCHFHLFIKTTTSGIIAVPMPLVQDLTDGAGHGLLVATDSMFVQVNSSTTSLTNTVRFKMTYRFKGVGLAEYIGIVQGQQ